MASSRDSSPFMYPPAPPPSLEVPLYMLDIDEPDNIPESSRTAEARGRVDAANNSSMVSPRSMTSMYSSGTDSSSEDNNNNDNNNNNNNGDDDSKPKSRDSRPKPTPDFAFLTLDELVDRLCKLNLRKEKLLLYLGLYETTLLHNKKKPYYHMAMVLGPKYSEGSDDWWGIRYHVVDGKLDLQVDLVADVRTPDALGFFKIAKVLDFRGIDGVLRGTPLLKSDKWPDCQYWAANVFKKLTELRRTRMKLTVMWLLSCDGEKKPIAKARLMKWSGVFDFVNGFVAFRKANGRYDLATFPAGKLYKPVYDLMKEKQMCK